MTTATSSRPIETLSDINKILQDLKLPIITNEQLTTAIQVHTRGKIVNALKEAEFNPKKRDFLVTVFPSTSAPELPEKQAAPESTQPELAETKQEAEKSVTRTYEPGIHVYAGGGALYFRPSIIEKENGNENTQTVTIEAARSTGKNTREYLWKEKIIVRLTRQELPEVLALFVACHPGKRVNKGNHGPDHTKWFSMERQDDRRVIFCVIGEGGKNDPGKRSVSVPVGFAEATEITGILLRQFAKNIGVEEMAAMGVIRANSEFINTAE